MSTTPVEGDIEQIFCIVKLLLQHVISVLLKYVCELDKNSEGPHMRETSYQGTDRPKVSFGACEEKQKSEAEKQNDLPKPTLRVAKGHYTPNPGKN